MPSDKPSQICTVCNRLWQRNMLAGADGNVSCKTSRDTLWITPSGQSKADLSPEEIPEIDLNGETVSGNGRPSGEKAMHLKIYQTCPEAQAVVHAHPPHAVAWSIALPTLKFLPGKSLSEVILACGDIPIVNYATPGTDRMGAVLEDIAPGHRVMILARHGAVSWGESLEEAYRGMERVEHAAQTLYLAHNLGGLTSLPKEEIQNLRSIREKMGKTTY